MGREIKFRARRVDDTIHNGSWVYGHYFTPPLTDENSGLPPESGWYFLSGGERRHCIEQNGVVYTIDPDTLGEYTSLKDKNGVEIYEGDIIRSYNLYGEAFAVLGVVKWHDELATYVGVIKDALGLEEVIGNIYENADLLANTVSE